MMRYTINVQTNLPSINEGRQQITKLLIIILIELNINLSLALYKTIWAHYQDKFIRSNSF